MFRALFVKEGGLPLSSSIFQKRPSQHREYGGIDLMRRFNKKRLFVMIAIMVALILFASVAFAADGEAEEVSPMANSFWALVPAIVAIAMALITKEVYSSLFAGIVVGALLAQNFQLMPAIDSLVQDGMIAAVSDTAGIFVFLVILGAVVALINDTGASAAFGRWAQTHIKSRIGAMIATFVLGVLIFIDDYFNCLTVGSVMSPITDRQKISRTKLAYLIDATAAPVCMIAPISSWAAAVSEYTSDVTTASGETISSLALFCKAIPYNFYSLLTFVFIIALVLMNVDFGPMKQHAADALAGNLHKLQNHHELEPSDSTNKNSVGSKAKLIDLLLPIFTLIVLSVFALIHVGGFFEVGGDYFHDFIGAFGNTDSTVALPMGSLAALILIMAYLLIRKLISFTGAMNSIGKGFTSMVPAILILTMAYIHQLLCTIIIC